MCKKISEWIVKSSKEAQKITGYNAPFFRVNAKMQTPSNYEGEKVMGWMANGENCSQIFIHHNKGYQETGEFWLEDISYL